VSSLWKSVFRLNPARVGGCRPIVVDAYVNPQEWRIVYRGVVTPFAVPSEVLVLETNGTPKNGLEPAASPTAAPHDAESVRSPASHEQIFAARLKRIGSGPARI